MNKKIIIVIIILAILLLAAGGFFIFSKNLTKIAPSLSGNTTQQANQANQPSSLKDLLTKNISQTCTFNTDGNKGTVYVSGGKVRADFEVTMESQTTKSHMIVDGNTSYIWMDGQTTGYKMSFNTQDQTLPTPGSANTQNFDPNQNLNYDCKPWVVDGSLLNLPSGINFIEFNIPTPPTENSNPTSGVSSQCAACNNLPAEAKNQCLTALKCK